MNGAELTRQFGSVADASLPEVYVQAKATLAQCFKVDECKAWADKAEAIRSYARQSGDEEMLRFAMKIRARATQRLGSLLEELERAKPGPKSSLGPGQANSPLLKAAAEAGLSPDQTFQAKAVNRLHDRNPELFDAMVEAPTPATVKALAREGRKPTPPPRTDHLRGATPAEFARTTHAQGEIRDMARMTTTVTPALVAQTAADSERDEMLGQLDLISEWCSQLTMLLRSGT